MHMSALPGNIIVMEQFVKTHLELLQEEREAEIEETRYRANAGRHCDLHVRTRMHQSVSVPGKAE